MALIVGLGDQGYLVLGDFHGMANSYDAAIRIEDFGNLDL
jgi:hypothetical protein